MELVHREIAAKVLAALTKYPIVAVTGPRQSGKTTLCKMVKPEFTYVNLEDLSLRSFAQNDPKGFLETYKGGVIIDEVQYVPELFSYLQVFTDQRNANGEYLLTGSQNFLMLDRISQSLAGRVALFDLLPFSLNELAEAKVDTRHWEPLLLNGAYPRKWMNAIDATDFYSNYVLTYVQRDVRLIKNIMNLDLFQRFIYLLAGRTGQLLNQSSLGSELGIDNKTVNAWMALLEASFIAFRLQPYYSNASKRLVKTPKVYFYDTGLLSYLLGIRTVRDLDLHYAKGQLFENFVVVELLKQARNRASHDAHFFWRDTSGHEIDLLIERGSERIALEIKSGKTIHGDFFKGLSYFKGRHPDVKTYLVYGGNEVQHRTDATVLGFNHLSEL